MFQAWLVVAPYSKFYKISTVLFHKYGGENVYVTNFMSHFSMLFPTKSTVKLANGNTGHAQGIGIILCRFTNCPIIYLVGPVYYCTGHHYNTISSGALKFYAGFQNITTKTLQHCDFVDPQGNSWRPPNHTENNVKYLQIKTVKVNPQINRNIFFPNVCSLSKT